MTRFLTYPHAVIADGVFYPTGEPVPVKDEPAAEAPADAAAGEPAKDEAAPENENKTEPDTAANEAPADAAAGEPAKDEAKKAAKKSANKGKGRKAKSADKSE